MQKTITGMIGLAFLISGALFIALRPASAAGTYLNRYVPTGGGAVALHADGAREKLFVATGHGLLSFDTRGNTPILIGQYRPDNVSDYPISDMEVQGSLAYLVQHRKALLIASVGAPSVPGLKGSVVLDEFARDVTVSGDYAYVTSATNWLNIVKVSDPTKPTFVRKVDLGAIAQKAVAIGQYLYVVVPGSAIEKGLLQIYDLAAPENPSLIGSVKTNGVALDLAVAGSYVYIADGSNGVTVVNASNPEQPMVVGNYDTLQYVSSVVVTTTPPSGRGPVVFASSMGRLYVIDVSDPTKPFGKQLLHTENGHALAWNGINLFLAERTKIGKDRIARLSYDPIARLPNASVNIGMTLQDVQVVGDTAIALDEHLGLHVIDVADPANPQFRGFADVPGPSGNVSQLAATSDRAYTYVAAKRNGLQVFSTTVQTHPRIQGSYARRGLVVWDVALQAEAKYAYLAAGKDGLIILDLSTPYKPKRVGQLKLPRDVRVVKADDYYVYLLGMDKGVYLIDASVPSAPKLVASSNIRLSDIVVSGDLMVGTSPGKGLRLLRVGTSKLTLLNTFRIGGALGRIDYDAGRVYVPNGSRGVQVVDVRDVENPQIVANLRQTNTFALGVDVVLGATAYVADRTGLLLYSLAGL